MNTTIIRTNRRKTTSKGMRTLITLKPVKKKSRDMPKRVQISINIEDCVSQNRRVVWSPAACDSLGVYMRRITYDSATVNISVFIEQRNISFQNDISLKTMRLGVLSWEKSKNRETHGRIVSLDQLEGRRAIADLFVMFIAWTSQKASKVHKLVSKLAIVLIWKIQSPHEDNRPVPPVKCTKSAHRGTATNTRDSCRSDIGRFRAEPTDLRKVSTSGWHICILQCPQ